MRVRNWIAASMIAALAGTGAAQNHASGYFGVTWASGGTAYGVHVDPTGTVTTMSLGSQSRYSVETASDNRSMLYLDHSANAVFAVDPIGLAVVGTVFSNPALSAVAYGLHYDCNGDLLVFSSSQLHKIDSVASALTTVASGSFGLGDGGIDIDTGDLLVATSSGLRRYDRTTGAVTTLATGGLLARYGSLAQDVLTGDVYVPTCCSTSTVPRALDLIPGGTGTASIWLGDPNLIGAYGVNADRASAATRRLISGCFRSSSVANSGGVWSIDLQTKAVTQLGAFTTTTVADVDFIGGRNLHAQRTAPGRYDVAIDLPFDGGNAYVVGISATGVRPATPLPDGRRIPLIFDNVTSLSVRGLGAPFLTGTIGVLDGFGRGKTTIDLSSFYPTVQGLRLWLTVVTFAAPAPLGIGTITDPFVIRVD